MKIGLISDTHSYLDSEIVQHFKDCDEIWHAGDIGDISVIHSLEKIALVRAVFGNIDGNDIRKQFKEHLMFSIQGLKIWITHIGGYPGNNNRDLKSKIHHLKPDLFICGHSHILKITRDPIIKNLIHMNPGAAGKYGFHKVKTLITFEIKHGKITNVNVIELGPRV